MTQDPKLRGICIDSTWQLVETRQLSFEDAQELVGGYLEAVRIDDKHVLLVDEEGLIKPIETAFTYRDHRFVGNGVIFGADGAELCDCSLTEESIAALVHWAG